MGRNISVMGGAGGGQWPEHGADNRHWFAIDWSRYKDGMVCRERERETRSEHHLWSLPLSCHRFFFVHCVKPSINRSVHLHPDTDTVSAMIKQLLDDTFITVGRRLVFEAASC